MMIWRVSIEELEDIKNRSLQDVETVPADSAAGTLTMNTLRFLYNYSEMQIMTLSFY